MKDQSLCLICLALEFAYFYREWQSAAVWKMTKSTINYNSLLVLKNQIIQELFLLECLRENRIRAIN